MCSACNTDLELAPEVREKVFYYQVIRALEREMSRRILDREERKAEILAEIDLALEKGDRKKFDYLATRYKKLFKAS